MTVVTYYPGYSQIQVSPKYIVRNILSITRANPMVITTDTNHGYTTGMQVRFLIPQGFGMVELNSRLAQITATTDDTITCNVNSKNFTPFAYPAPLPDSYTYPSVIPNSSGSNLNSTIPDPNQNNFKGTFYNGGRVQ